MAWLKHVVVDLLATVCILLATVLAMPWAAWVVWIYTPLMLLLKLAALGAKLPKAKDTAPDWIFHVLYGVNLAALLIYGWYWEAAGWAAIWVLSAVVSARQRA